MKKKISKIRRENKEEQIWEVKEINRNIQRRSRDELQTSPFPQQSNLRKQIEENLRNIRNKNLNYHFRRYQDEESWFDFQNFYVSLKAKNIKTTPNPSLKRKLLNDDNFSNSSSYSGSLTSKPVEISPNKKSSFKK